MKRYTNLVALMSEIIAPLSVIIVAIYIAHNLNNPLILFYFGFAIFISYLLQSAIGRKRPYISDHLYKYGGIFLKSEYSFPSLHAVSLGIFAPALFIINITLFYFWIIWIGFISWTRVFLNMHYISDVVAGTLWGMILGVVILSLI